VRIEVEDGAKALLSGLVGDALLEIHGNSGRWVFVVGGHVGEIQDGNKERL